MKIIIIGDGKVGYSLADNLSQEGNDVTIIDDNADALKKSNDNLDVMHIKGNGVSAKTLINAGVKTVDVLIAATTNDETNMVCCLTAKILGASHTIARIRDPEYADELFLLKNELGLDMIINPEQVAATEITRLIKFPTAINVEGFAKDRVEMVEIKVTSDMLIVDTKVQDIPLQLTKSIIIGAIMKNDTVIIPHGNVKIELGDILFIFGKPSYVYQFCKKAGKFVQKTKNAMIVGGGRISYYLAKKLCDIDIKVKIIEINHEKCMKLSEMLPKALIIHGDGTDEDLLKSENISEIDVFVSATGKDEENLIAGLLAKQNGTKKVITKISRMNYFEIVHKMGIESVISPRVIITNHILRYVRGLDINAGNKIETLFKLENDQAEVLEFSVSLDAKYINVKLKNLNLIHEALVAAIVRNNEVIIPRGNDTIQKGDRVIVITKEKNITDLGEIISSEGDGHELQNNIKKFGDIINM